MQKQNSDKVYSLGDHTILAIVQTAVSSCKMFRLVSALVFLSACQLQSIDGNPALNTECTSGDNYCYRSDVCAYVLTYQSIDNCSCTELERLVTAIDEVAGNVGLLGHRIDITEDQIETIDQEQESNRLILHQLGETLTADEEAMRELERRVESLPNDTTISDALAPIEDGVGELELRLRRQQASLEEKSVALIACQGDLTGCQRELDNELEQSTNLAHRVNVKSTRIGNLNSEIQNQRRQIASLRSELSATTERLTRLSLETISKSTQIALLNAQLQRC
ncbi:ELKS/Rab6-interacting/CAST family member 1-like [Ptychodera flava]|uniref:ELKS/Rab6-interacting/CAST family member 1-like n=1 Tax=Ptychodera flava TaxID=63121 RepID=UPI003969CA86